MITSYISSKLNKFKVQFTNSSHLSCFCVTQLTNSGSRTGNGTEPYSVVKTESREPELSLEESIDNTVSCKKYTRIEKIGEGTYGVVHKALDSFGTAFALKTIRLELEENGIPENAIREITILKELRHPSIIQLIDVIYIPNRLTLVFEYLDQDLKKLLDACEKGLDISTTRSFMFQLLAGASHCHECQILHRDLKPQNLLINREGNLKIADFGLARTASISVNRYTHEVVTLWYRAPDILLGSQHYDTKLDIWSIGCIFVEMINGRPAFPGTEETQLEAIFKSLGSPDINEWPEIQNLPHWTKYKLPYYPPVPLSQFSPRFEVHGASLAQSMLRYQPESRISASKALKHTYFTSISPFLRNTYVTRPATHLVSE